MKNPPMQTSCLSSLEGVLLKNPDTFSYFMLVAFEASGLIRFTLLLLLWPFISILRALDMDDLALKLMIFVSTAGVRVKEIESVARAVLPKFYYDDIDFDQAWKVFSSYEKRVVVTKMPTMMVERFVKEHLMADEVIGTELKVNTRFGFVTGFVKSDIGSVRDRVVKLFGDEMKPSLGMIRRRTTKVDDSDDEFISLCEDQCYPPFFTGQTTHHHHLTRPVPVIFHDGRLVKRPTPFTSLLILLWLPIGILLATIRIIIGIITPIQALPYINAVFGGGIHVKGKPPPPPPTKTSKTTSPAGVLFVCTHRTLMDPVILSYALNRRIPAVTYSISRLTEILSPIPTVRLTRVRSVDADRIKSELAKGDLVVCPEGTTCREPFLLRFSALFAELTDRIVPVAMNYRVGFFHATTARGWKGLDPVFFFMNPRPVYEVTFLNQLPVEATCSAGKSPQDVANYVQRLLAATLGFECTNFTRKDKYRLLAGNDGTVVRRGGGGGSKWWSEGAKKVVRVFKPCIH